MRIGLIGDVHLADVAPSIRTEDYRAQILDKLSWIVTDAKERGCDQIVQAGDLWHVKAPSRTSHELVQATADIFAGFPGPVLVVPGNHDMQHDRIESLSRQPLGTLCKAPNVDMLMGEHGVVFGIPWLYDWRVLGGGWFRRWRESEAELLVTHAPIFPPGLEPPYDYLPSEWWARAQGRGWCYYGHIHEHHGTYQVENVTFCNQGALSRGSLHEETLRRRPAYTVWTSDAGFERVEVPHLPVGQVFRLARKEDVDERQGRVDSFLEGVEETELGVLSVELIAEHARAKGLRARALEQLEQCLEVAGHG